MPDPSAPYTDWFRCPRCNYPLAAPPSSGDAANARDITCPECGFVTSVARAQHWNRVSFGWLALPAAVPVGYWWTVIILHELLPLLIFYWPATGSTHDMGSTLPLLHPASLGGWIIAGILSTLTARKAFQLAHRSTGRTPWIALPWWIAFSVGSGAFATIVLWLAAFADV